MKIPIVTSEAIMLRNTEDAASSCAIRYRRANTLFIERVGCDSNGNSSARV
jgi:hypothetical protein